MKFFAFLTLLAALISAGVLTLIFSEEVSAVQQGALAAAACGVAIVPYIAMRSLEIILRIKSL